MKSLNEKYKTCTAAEIHVQRKCKRVILLIKTSKIYKVGKLHKVLYTPYISRGFYFRESGAIREFDNTQK